MRTLKTHTEDEGAVSVITLDPEPKWARCEFPHPLVAVDFDAEGKLICVEAVGSVQELTAQICVRWAQGDEPQERLLALLKAELPPMVLVGS